MHTQVFIGTPRGRCWSPFKRQLRVIPESVLPGAGTWFMRRWHPEHFEPAVHAICDGAGPGPDWGTVASRVGRLIPWEFDYQYDARVNMQLGPFPPAREPPT